MIILNPIYDDFHVFFHHQRWYLKNVYKMYIYNFNTDFQFPLSMQ